MVTAADRSAPHRLCLVLLSARVLDSKSVKHGSATLIIDAGLFLLVCCLFSRLHNEWYKGKETG